jgi:crotonobetainyl-CoA:carnitine CoA-transferase CaiB-like acyl-CoA transferase
MNAAVNERLPLAGYRVLDLGQIYAVPYMGALLADLGAENIKIEAPHRADSRRTDAGLQGTFQVLNRGKKGMSIDLAKPKGVELFKKLVAVSDIVIENFTPRVMPNFGLSHAELAKVNPRIIMLSNCGYGATGPWGPLPIQGTSLESTMGIIGYTGYPDMPSKAGQSYPDFLACWTGVTAILAALEHVEKTGRGQWIDEGMYQNGVGLIPEPILKVQIDGKDYERIGNRHPWKAPSNCYRAAGEDRWLTISVDTDERWQKLAGIMGKPELATDERFATVTARHNNVDEVDAIVGAWVREREAEAAMKLLQSHGIAAGVVLNAADLTFNEQMLHRKFYEPVDYGDEAGIRPLIGRPYKMRNTPIHIKNKAPEFADSTSYVLRDILKLPEDEIAELFADGAVVDEPVSGRGRGGGGGGVAGVRIGSTVTMDENYLEKLNAVYGRSAASQEATEVPSK